MIIKSTLGIDQQEGTIDLAVAAQRTAFGATLSYGALMRLLVWHTPEPQQFAAAAGVLAPLCQKLKARQARVVGITPNLFALGLYPVGLDPLGNPAAIVLLDLNSEGTLVAVEQWGSPESRLTRIFDDHSNEIHPDGWLQVIAGNWVRSALTLEGFLRHAQLRPVRGPHPHNTAKPAKPARAGAVEQAPTRGQRQSPKNKHVQGTTTQAGQAGKTPPTAETTIKGSRRRERAAINKQLRATQ